MFDPANYLAHWPHSFDNMKTGLVGGHLGVANVGAFSSQGGGFELVAFGPVPPHEPGGAAPPVPYSPPPLPPPPPSPPSPKAPWRCVQFNATTLAWIAKCGGRRCDEAACTQLLHHNWTQSDPGNKNHTGCGTCWCCEPSSDSLPPSPTPALPRLPNINYNPGVFIMLRDQSNSIGPNATVNGSRYFYANNQTTRELVGATGAAQFYAALLAVYRKDRDLLAEGMQVVLPASDRRQSDMANTAMLATLNNFVGNQSNYGFGATYWSYGREDNGSLPLNILSVDEALLNWGKCTPALEHLRFYFENVIAADGTVTYGCCKWGAGTDRPEKADGIADYGRLLDLFLRAVEHCDPPVAWQRALLPKVEAIGRFLLGLRALAPPLAPPPPPPQPPPPPAPPVACQFGPEINNSYIAGWAGGCSGGSSLGDLMAQCANASDCGGVCCAMLRFRAVLSSLFEPTE